MAWTADATSKDADPNSDQSYINVKFANGARSFTRRFGIDPTTTDGDIQQFAKTVIAQLDGRDVAFAVLTLGSITPGDKPSTQDEIDLKTFLDALRQVQANKTKVDSKLLDPLNPADQKTIDDDFAVFKTAYNVHPDLYDKYLARGGI